MKVIRDEDIIDMYIERFGEKPQLQGGNWWEAYPVDKVWAAIQTGIPIKEDPYPEGVDT